MFWNFYVMGIQPKEGDGQFVFIVHDITVGLLRGIAILFQLLGDPTRPEA